MEVDGKLRHGETEERLVLKAELVIAASVAAIIKSNIASIAVKSS